MFPPVLNENNSMPVQVYWLDEPWVTAIDLSGMVTTDDMREVIRTCLSNLKSHPVYFLIDMTAVEGIEPRIFELSSLSEWIYHPNGRWFVYVKPHRMFSAVMKMRQRGNYKSFDTREEAKAFLQSSTQAERQRAKLF
jgi:hypothetical protein